MSQRELGGKASREKGLLCLYFGPLSDTNVMPLKIILHSRKHVRETWKGPGLSDLLPLEQRAGVWTISATFLGPWHQTDLPSNSLLTLFHLLLTELGIQDLSACQRSLIVSLPINESILHILPALPLLLPIQKKPTPSKAAAAWEGCGASLPLISDSSLH